MFTGVAMKNRITYRRREFPHLPCSFILILSFFILSFTPHTAFAKEALVEAFSPSGQVKKVHQVSTRFSVPMVPFGNPRSSDPFTITCPLPGKGRWLDERTWVYDFDKDLPAGVDCSFVISPGARTLAGQPITGRRSFSFSTGGPAVTDMVPHKDSTDIDENQAFIAILNGEPEEATVRQFASCFLPATKERVGITIIQGKVKNDILRAEYIGQGSGEKKPVIVFQCARPLPPKSPVTIVWGKGIRSRSGVKTTADQIFTYKTRGPFTATIHCPKETPKSGCIPILPLHIRFSAPVSKNLASQITLVANNRTYRAVPDPQGGDYVYRATFPGPFSENSSAVITIPDTLKDDAGRRLSNRAKFPSTVSVGPYPPLAKFSSRFGIVENDDPVLPVTVRNIEPNLAGHTVIDSPEGPDSAETPETKRLAQPEREDRTKGTGPVSARVKAVTTETEIIAWLKKLAVTGRSRSVFAGAHGLQSFSIPRPGGQKAFEVIGLPLKQTGFHVVELESAILGQSLLGKQRSLFVPTGALVTNLSAHLKWGRESSLVWVTYLDSGRPVENASVTVRDCTGKVLWKGLTDQNGIGQIRTVLPNPDETASCRLKQDSDLHYDSSQLHALQSITSGLFVFAGKDGDLTFVHSSWDEGIEPYRFRLTTEGSGQAVIAHTIFDRTLIRAGDHLHMKHLIRKESVQGLGLEKGDLPERLILEHVGTSEKYTLPLVWDRKTGSAENLWSVPKGAKLGSYSVSMVWKEKKGGKEPSDRQPPLLSGGFRVEEFKVPLMKATIRVPGGELVRPSQVDIDLAVEHLSGGPARALPVRLRGQVLPKQVTFDSYDDFIVANGGVKPGISRRGDDQQDDDTSDDGERGSRTSPAAGTTKSLTTRDVKLDTTGAARITVDDVPVSPEVRELLTELEFRDPNGEIQTVSRRITLWPSRALAGLRTDSWVSAKGTLSYQIVALDTGGKPLSGISVSSQIFKQDFLSHRKRLIGGFYSYEHVREIKPAVAGCSGITDNRGLLLCTMPAPGSGNFIIEGRADDGSGNISLVNEGLWISGDDEWWFDVGDGDRIDLIPEKRRYEPGEKARFQVRAPMREATVLVTVEREGILDAFVTELSGKEPVIELPVKEGYAPNIFVSVLAVRGRVKGPKPTAMFDPAKPLFKLGIAEIAVGWSAHELKVAVLPEKKTYRVRENASVKVQARTGRGEVPPAPASVTVAVVDEGLLELAQNKSWGLLERMMRKRGYSFRTSTAQSQVIGKRHYGLKALPRGGGGGKQLTRELFDTLVYWKGTVPLDSHGEATITFPLNDSITGFVVAAIATAGEQFFGTGTGTIRTHQEIVLASAIPLTVREQDRFPASFTVRNTTDKPERLTLSASVGISGTGQPPVLPPRTETIQPGEAKEMAWDITVPAHTSAITWTVTARDPSGTIRDSLKTTQTVAPLVPVRVIQSRLSQITGHSTVPVEKPKEAVDGKGGVSVTLSPSLSGSLSPVADYMNTYPFTCLEQKISKAIVSRNQKEWGPIMAELATYLDSEGFLKYFPDMARGSDILSSYVLAISHEAGIALPKNVEDRVIAALTAFVEGKTERPQPFPVPDLTVRKLAAIEALSRKGKASAKHVESIRIEPNLWPTSALLDWIGILARIPVTEKETRQKQAEQILRSRITFHGSVLTFSTDKGDSLWWLMSNTDTNSLRTILTFLTHPRWKDDMPKLVRGALARRTEGRWSTTVANAWGVEAVNKFARHFENIPLSGTTTVSLGTERSTDWNQAPKGASFDFPWPREKGTVTIRQTGRGAPWASVSSLAAIPLAAPAFAGFRVTKTLTPVDRQSPRQWTAGDVTRVRVDMEAQSDMTWVVLSDPVPSGATILGGQLGRDSSILTSGERVRGWIRPDFTERSSTAFRAYYQFVPKGKWSVEYTVRLNTAGVFGLPATRLEALYAPDMFGEIPNPLFSIHPGEKR